MASVPYQGLHQWQMRPETKYERRTCNNVRESKHTVMLFDKRYMDIDTGKYDTDKLPTIHSTPWEHLWVSGSREIKDYETSIELPLFVPKEETKKESKPSAWALRQFVEAVEFNEEQKRLQQEMLDLIKEREEQEELKRQAQRERRKEARRKLEQKEQKRQEEKAYQLQAQRRADEVREQHEQRLKRWAGLQSQEPKQTGAYKIVSNWKPK